MIYFCNKFHNFGMMSSITFRCNIANITVRSAIHGTIRMNWWERHSFGSNRLQTDDLVYSATRPFPACMNKAWTFCEEDYSTFCWFTSKDLDDGETEFSYTTRAPFRIEVDQSTSLPSSFAKRDVITLIISKCFTHDNIEKSGSTSKSYPGLNKTSPGMRHCIDALYAARLG